MVPPDPIPNSEVKRHSADDSVDVIHVKVGHCQAFNTKPPGCPLAARGFSFMVGNVLIFTTKDACDNFAGSEIGRTQCARRASHKDVASQSRTNVFV